MSVVHDLQLASTLMLCGLIWTVQLVHYPAFRFVSRERFEGFHRFHSLRITMVAAVLMPVEAVTAAIIAWMLPGTLAFIGLGLVAVIWASTALLQVPAHAKLAKEFDEGAHAKLVHTNWIRTAAWSARAALLTALG